MSALWRLLKLAWRERIVVIPRPNPLAATAAPEAFMTFAREGRQKIVLAYNPIWNPLRTQVLLDAAQRIGIDSPIDTIVDAVAQHELGHRDINPKTLDHAERMTRAVAWVLAQDGKYSPHATQYVTNLISDLIVNTTLAGPAGPRHFADGLLFSYYEELDQRGFRHGKTLFYLTRTSEFRFEGPYPPLFSVFLDVMLERFRRPDLTALIRPLLTRPDAVRNAVAAITGYLEAEDLSDVERWPTLCERITIQLLPFIGRDLASTWTRPCHAFGEVPIYAPGERPALEGSHSVHIGEPLFHRKRHEAYVRRAATLRWEAIRAAFQAGLEQIHIPVRFDPRFVTGAADSADAAQNLLFLLDCSASMGFGRKTEPDWAIGFRERYADDVADEDVDPTALPGHGNRVVLPWGDQSRYDAGVLLLYCIMRTLQERPGAVAVRVAAFHRQLRATPWHAPGDFASYVPQVVLPGLGLGTRLSADLVASLVEGRSRCVTFLITDGALGADDVRDLAAYLRERGDQLRLIVVRILVEGDFVEELAVLPNVTIFTARDVRDILEFGVWIADQELL